MIPFTAHAQDLPTQGVIVAGAGTIVVSGPQMTITATTDRSAIDWASFSIAAGNTVSIAQPNARSVNINRVLGSDPSQIFGSLESNGRVVLANPNGVWFGPSAHVDVAGVVASAGRIGDADLATFASGGALYVGAGSADATVVNEGRITVAQGGMAALVAPGVRNSGIISARLGQVTLAAGRTTTLDFYGDGLINLAVGGQTGAAATVDHSGTIYAEGGQVRLSAGTAQDVLGGVINMSGAIEARGISTAGGIVELLAAGGSVAVSGSVDVGSAGRDGGRITIRATGAEGVLDHTGTLNASSGTGTGGSVDAEARFAYLGGAIHADGASGGAVAIGAAGITQNAAITANGGSGAGGSVLLDAGLNITQTTSALTSANSAAAAGGTVTARTGAAGRTFSSGTLTATGATGGTVAVLGNGIALAAATLDAGGTGDGGNVLVGGDLHGVGTQTAAMVLVNGATKLRANAGTTGKGGKIVVWSDEATDYQGSAVARGGTTLGDGGMIEVSSAGLLTFTGAGDAGATHGKAGTLLLDPKNIVISDAAGGLAVFDLIDPNAGAGSGFGTITNQLANGTILVTKPLDTVGGFVGAGSVYYYDPLNGALLGTFQGSHTGDNVGSAVTYLNYKPAAALLPAVPNNTKSYLIGSTKWSASAGAVTWVASNGMASGVLSSANSLVGTSAADGVGARVSILLNDNYVVSSQAWGGARGAITFGSAATGITGAVSATNSLIGTLTAAVNADGRPGDAVGSGSFVQLANGNFVVMSPNWNKQGGAISFGSGTTGFANLGVVGAANSLVGNGGVNYSALNTPSGTTTYGFYGGDQVGSSSSNIKALTNGNYTVTSANWDHAKGAVTLVDGTTGLNANVSALNSLVGTRAGVGDTSDGVYTYYTTVYGGRGYYSGDTVGSGGITELTGGGFVISSPGWNVNRGAVNYVGAGTTALAGTITAGNSLTGTTAGTFSGYDSAHQPNYSGGDLVGRVTALVNGNYVVASSSWNGTRGAVTLMDGTNGIATNTTNYLIGETVSTDNSLFGTNAGDAIGSTITPLIGSSDFIASTSTWSSGRGAVTLSDGGLGVIGQVTMFNSLVGTTPYEYQTLGGDNVGSTVRALATGGFVILSPNWNKTRGAATFFAPGTFYVNGNISSANSLVGVTGATGGGVYCFTCAFGNPDIFGGDLVGSGGVKELTNGNFLLLSSNWSSARGAITFVNGTTGALVDGTGSLTGNISAANSLVGSQAATVYTSAYNVSGLSSVGRKYYVGGDQIGSSGYSAVMVQLANGNFVLQNSKWRSNTGAVTWGSANGLLGDGSAFAGIVSSANSLVGSNAATLNTPANTTTADYALNADGDVIGTQRLKDTTTGDYLLFSDKWSASRGAITWGSGTSGVVGTVSASNSLVGSTATDRIGITGSATVVLPDGHLLAVNRYWNTGSGAVTYLAPDAATVGLVSSTNSFVGAAGDQLGSGGVTVLAGGDYVINSPIASGNAGAVTWSNGTGALTGTRTAINSFLGLATSNTMASTATLDPDAFIIAIKGEGTGRVVLGFTDPTLWSYARAPQANLTIAPSLITASLNSGTSLVLQASNDITISSAIRTNAGSTANLTLSAGRSILSNNVINLGNGSLTMLANDSLANGVINAHRDAGAAAIFFNFGASVTTGAGSVSITLAASTDKTYNATGEIALGNINAASVTVLNQGVGNLSLNGPIVTTAAGTSILLSTLGNFRNFVGANALDPGAGRYLVYSADPRTNTLGSLAADGKFYGRTLALDAPSSFAAGDNLLLYGVVPVLTVTSNATVGYGDATPALTAGITGLIDGDTLGSATTGSAALGTAYVAGDAVGGNHAITVGAGDLASALGYGFAYVDGGVTVTPKQLTVGLIAPANRTYDGTTVATLGTANYGIVGLFGSDEIAINRTVGAYAARDVGTGILVSTTLAGGDFTAIGGTLLANYVLPTGVASGAIGGISAKTLTLIGLTAAGRVYDAGTVAALSGGTLSGIVTSDAVTLVTGSGAFASKDIGVNKAVTVSGFGITGAGAGNYVFAGQPSGLTATITAKALTLAGVTAAGRGYDGSTAVVLSGGTLGGIEVGDLVALQRGTGAIADKNIGTARAVTASGFAIAGTDAANYTLAGQPAGLTATVTAKALTLTGVVAADRVYDGSATARLTGGTLTGIVTNDIVGIVAGVGAFADRNVGVGRAVTASGYGIAGTDAGNYVLTAQPAALIASIVAKALTLNGVTAIDRSYDGTLVVALTGGTLGGVLTNDAITLTAGSGAFVDKNAGAAKAVTVSGYDIAGADAANYTLNGQPLGLTASVAATTLTLSGVTAANQVYDGSTVATLSGGTLAGIVTNDAIDLVAGSGAFADKNVGVAKQIAASGYGLSGLDAGNYTLAAQPTGLTATVAAKTVSLIGITALDRDYDGSIVAALTGGTLNGLIVTDAVDLIAGSGTFADRNVGTAKTVTVGGFALDGVDAANYLLTAQPNGLTASIAPKALTIVGVTTADRAYDGSLAVALLGGALTGLVEGDSVDLVTGTGTLTDRHVGVAKIVTAQEYAIQGLDMGNYTLAGQPTDLAVRITARMLTLEGVTAADRDYDGTLIAALAGGNLAGGISELDPGVVLVRGTGSFADKNAGVAKAIAVSGFALSGEGAGDYALVGQPSGLTATIAPKGVTIGELIAVDRIYDGTAAVALSGGLLAGLVAGDALDIVAGSAAFADKNVGIGKAVTVSGYGFTGTEAGNYMLLGQPAGLTGSVFAKAITLGDVSAIDRNYDGTVNVAISGGTLSGIVTGDAIDLIAGSGTFADKDAGLAKSVSVSGYGIAGGDAGNYILISEVSGLTATVTPRSLVLGGVTAISRAYDGSLAAQLQGGTLSGILEGDSVGVSAGQGWFADRNVGTAMTVLASGYGLNGSDARNYALAAQPAGLSASIIPAQLRVSFAGSAPIAKTYDGTATATLLSGSYRIEGLAAGESIAIAKTGGSYASANAGAGIGVTTSLSAADFVAGAGTALSNYALPTGTLFGSVGVITPAVLTVRADDLTIEGGPIPTLSVTYSGFVGSDTSALLTTAPTASTLATDASGGGLYRIKVGGGSAANYTLDYVDGILTITPVPVLVPLQAILANNLPIPTVTGPLPNIGARTEEVLFGVDTSLAFIPDIASRLRVSALLQLDQGQAANAYANDFLDAIELESQE